MLEQAGLLLYPWGVANNASHGTSTPRRNQNDGGSVNRPIATVAGDRLLGFARKHPPHWPRWLAWLASQKVQLFETEDASLVETLHRPWGLWRGWEVLDAEDRSVGCLYRGGLVDAYGQRLGRLVAPGPTTPGKIIDCQKEELGTWLVHANGNIALTFGRETNPFIRMIVLGAVLLFC